MGITGKTTGSMFAPVPVEIACYDPETVGCKWSYAPKTFVFKLYSYYQLNTNIFIHILQWMLLRRQNLPSSVKLESRPIWCRLSKPPSKWNLCSIPFWFMLKTSSAERKHPTIRSDAPCYTWPIRCRRCRSTSLKTCWTRIAKTCWWFSTCRNWPKPSCRWMRNLRCSPYEQTITSIVHICIGGKEK